MDDVKRDLLKRIADHGADPWAQSHNLAEFAQLILNDVAEMDAAEILADMPLASEALASEAPAPEAPGKPPQ